MLCSRAFSTFAVLLSVLQATSPIVIEAQSSQAIRANEQGVSDLKYNVLGQGAGSPIPWSVLRQWVVLRTKTRGWPNQRLFAEGSPFIDLKVRAPWYEEAQEQLEMVRNNIQASFPVATGTSYAQMLDSQNTEFMKLQQSFEANARVRVPGTLKTIQTTSLSVRIAATQALVPSTVSKEAMTSAKDAGSQLQSLLDPQQLRPEDLASIKAGTEIILATLTVDKQNALKDLPEGLDKYRQIAAQGMGTAKDASQKVQRLLEPRQLTPQELATAQRESGIILSTLTTEAQNTLNKLSEGPDKYRQIAAVGVGLVDSISTRVQTAPVALDQALNLAKSFGQFEKAQSDLVSNFASQSQAVQQSLSTDLDAAEKAWPRLLQDALAVQIEPGKPIPEEVKRVASFTEQFSQLKDVLQGRVQGLGNPSATAMLTFGIAQTNLASPALVQNLAALATTKGDYASAALGLASSLGINPPPAIASVLPLLGTAASFMSGAGALSAISGLAGGGGILSFAGGFGGGGKDYSADFAKIEAELAQINQRLSAIEGKLDRLEQEIRANQQEVMSALEAINFDVSRTHALLLNEFHGQRLGPCKAAANRPKSQDPLSDVTECDRQLDLLLTGEDTPTLFTLEMNLTSPSLQATALAASTSAKSVRAALSRLVRGKDGTALFFPSATIDDLTLKLQNPSSKPIECDVIMTRRKLLEPGIVSTYVGTEQDALLASYKSPTASQWWSHHGDSVRQRWLHEVELLDDTVAQQTILVGDLALPEIVKAIDNKSDLRWLKESWGTDPPSILAENVTRYWMWQKLESQPGAARTLYDFAWNSNDPRFWYELTGSTPDKVTFSQDVVTKVSTSGDSQDETIWFVTFAGFTRVPLPTPKEWMHFELRWTNALTDVVSTRRRLIDELAGMEYLSSLRSGGKMIDILQVFALAEPAN